MHRLIVDWTAMCAGFSKLDCSSLAVLLGVSCYFLCSEKNDRPTTAGNPHELSQIQPTSTLATASGQNMESRDHSTRTVSWIVTRPDHAVVRLQISNTNTDVTTCSSEVLTILAASPSRPRTEGTLRLSPKTLYGQLGFTKRVLDTQKSLRRVFRCT